MVNNIMQFWIFSRLNAFLGVCVGIQLPVDVGTEFGSHHDLDLISGHVEPVHLTIFDKDQICFPMAGWHAESVSAHDGNRVLSDLLTP